MNGLEIMLAELEGNRLEVALIPCRKPCNEGGSIRVAVAKNATWYRRFCGRNLSSRLRRNPDTRIRRKDVQRLLSRLIAGFPSRSKYVPEIRAIAAQMDAKEAAA
jgi:hypothetical protein